MSHHPPTRRPDPWVRFRHGAFECTVVSDGALQMGPAHVNFPTADQEEVEALLHEHHLPSSVRLALNILVVDTGDALVLFDTAVGTDPDLGRGSYGPGTGHLLPRLSEAGIGPADIDVVAITHTHPDHVWGLVDVDGVPNFPRATVAVSREDFDHWTNPAHLEAPPSPHTPQHFAGARKSLLPYADAGRITWTGDGTEVVSGVTAIATPGHSPGHLVYRVVSEGQAMVVWGDLCHHQVLLSHPEWAFRFDADQSAATAQRWRVYDLVTSRRDAVLACHFPFPGLGHLRRDGQGYAWLPAELDLRP